MRKLTRYWPLMVITLFGVVLAYLNYQPNTWLSGWDNLHPEFNLWVNIHRSLDAVWQEYQGLGLLGGMAHAADLPRQLVLAAFGVFMPQIYVRYLWTFLMLILGPLGVYFLAQLTILRKFSLPTRQIAGLFAGLFYLLNLATVQTFYTPFESFSSFYGFFPWLVLALVYYLNKNSKRSLFILLVTTFLASPAFYVQTLFVVYLVTILPFLVSKLIYSKFDLSSIKRVVLALLTIFCASAYWLLPVAYFTLTSANTTVDAAQNLVATPETIARNVEAGAIQNIPTLKGFWFDYVDLAANNRFGYLMGPWVNHLATPAVQAIGLGFFVLIIVGSLYVIRRKLNYGAAVIVMGLVSIFFLINLNPPTGHLFEALQNSVPLLRQFFRAVFTKWAPVAELSYALLFSVGVIFLMDLFSFLHYRFTNIITTFTLVLGLIVFTAPAFQGYLVYPSMRVNIPTEYFDLFNYMKGQSPTTRIMNLPQHTFWGWEFYNWGYRGSGFLWYGLEQPILDRAFDVWSGYSQQYYTEVQHAIYAQSEPELGAILNKYGVTWILVDDNIVNPGSDDSLTLYVPQIKSMLARMPNVHLEKDFNSLHLFKVELQSTPKDFVITHALTPYIPLENEVSSPSSSIIDTPVANHSNYDGKARNCDNFNALLYTQTNTTDEVDYRAERANACDHFLYPDLSHDSSYQFKITHRNLTGSPFFVCIEDYVSKQCLVYRYLPSSPDWTTTTLDIPAMKEGEKGYALHLYTYSLSHQPSENAWRQIEIVPGPVKSPVHLSPLSQPLVSVDSTLHDSYSLYSLSVTAPGSYGMLVLNQSFDKGWKAYIVDDLHLTTTWQRYLAATFRQPLPDNTHLIAYSWANAWLIPSGKHDVLLVYQPELWQFLGFILLPLPMWVIWFFHRKK